LPSHEHNDLFNLLLCPFGWDKMLPRSTLSVGTKNEFDTNDLQVVHRGN
jgi:hypothetical protein